MTTIVTRSGKGSSLSWTEADANFTNLNNDKLETSTVGVTVQPHSNNLDSFSTVAPTAVGLALLDDVDATAQRTTLGLGNVDNTSDATKNTAPVTLTNKTLITPILTSPQIGNSGTATQNFTLTAAAVDGTMKLARGNTGATTQDILTVDVAGKVDIPQLVRSLGTTGSLELPSGLILKWGSAAIVPAGVVVTFTTPFPTACYAVFGTAINAGNAAVSVTVGSVGTGQFSIWAANASSVGLTIGAYWFAIGK